MILTMKIIVNRISREDKLERAVLSCVEEYLGPEAVTMGLQYAILNTVSDNLQMAASELSYAEVLDFACNLIREGVSREIVSKALFPDGASERTEENLRKIEEFYSDWNEKKQRWTAELIECMGRMGVGEAAARRIIVESRLLNTLDEPFGLGYDDIESTCEDLIKNYVLRGGKAR